VLKIPFRSRFQSFQRFWKLGLASRCTLGIILASMTPIPAIADVMRANGDHTRFDTRLLKVVDRDPKGLNCRMPKKFRPALMDSTDAPNLDRNKTNRCRMNSRHVKMRRYTFGLKGSLGRPSDVSLWRESWQNWHIRLGALLRLRFSFSTWSAGSVCY
jgi:hypothetical protein